MVAKATVLGLCHSDGCDGGGDDFAGDACRDVLASKEGRRDKPRTASLSAQFAVSVADFGHSCNGWNK